MASRDINDLCPEMQPICREFLAQCKAMGLNAAVDCTYRSNEEQNDAYAKGRTAAGEIITYAKAGQSKHNVMGTDGNPASRAFDIYLTNADGTLNWDATSLPWQKAIEIGRNLGLVCGADWPHPKRDCPHFELKT